MRKQMTGLGRAAAVAMVGLLLAGCVTKLTWPQREALDSLVGRSQPALIAMVGEPTSTHVAGNATVLTYTYRHAVFQVGDPDPVQNPPLTLQNHAVLQTETCDTSFRVTGGRVAAWSVQGSDCAHAPYPVLTNIKQKILDADAAGGTAGLHGLSDFPYNVRTGNSRVLSGVFQQQ